VHDLLVLVSGLAAVNYARVYERADAYTLTLLRAID
jgi:hypothetical protein